MESGSSGSWSDYSPSSIKKATSDAIEASGASAGVSAGGGGTSRCILEVDSLDLEDVARSEFYKANGQVAKVGEAVQVKKEVVDGRLAVELASGSKMIIGLLPSKYNFLRMCMEEGYLYKGEIVLSKQKPLPSISISLQNS